MLQIQVLDGGGLGVALDDEEPAQVGPILAGHLLPHGLAEVVAEGNTPLGLGVGEEDAPAVVGHLDVVEVDPPLLPDVDRGAQVDVVVLERDRAELPPPLDEPRPPRLQRPLEAAVAGQLDVVGDGGAYVASSHPDHTLARS